MLFSQGNRHLAKLLNSGDLTEKGPQLSQASTVFASSLNQSKVTAVQMAPVDEAMCYFTKLGGKFRGGGEFAEITPEFNSQGIKVWVLRAQSLQPDGVTGSARCYRRNRSRNLRTARP